MYFFLTLVIVMKKSRNKKVRRHYYTNTNTRKNKYIPDESKEITAIVDSTAIKHNLAYLHKKTGTQIMPVLKANAYGHGLIGVAKICRDAGIKYLGVATIGEALAIRNSGDKGDILAWLYSIDNPELKTAIAVGIDIGIFDETHVDALAALVQPPNRCRVHIHVDTGINRSGVPYTKAVETIKKIKSNRNLELIGMMSHLIDAELKRSKRVMKQLTRFRKLRDKLIKMGIQLPYVHIANSGGCLNYDVSDFTLCRAGIAVYGVNPDGNPDTHLKPALKIVSPLVQLKYISKDDVVGYDATFKAQKTMRIGIIAVGYADTIPRNASGKMFVSINGTNRAVLGLESMDQIVVEAKEGDVIGDEAIIFGEGGISVQQLAKFSKSSPYEILVHTGGRVRFIYI
jgi:alanine racemase